MGKQEKQAETWRVDDFDELFPGRFWKAGELKGGRMNCLITDIHLEKLQGSKGVQKKGILSIRGSEKQIVLNKTNGLCLREMFGRDPNKWIGHEVTFFAGTHDGEPCLRVWGSRELERDKIITVDIGHRTGVKITLHAVRPAGVRNGSNATNATKPADPPAQPRDYDPETSDPPPPDDVDDGEEFDPTNPPF